MILPYLKKIMLVACGVAASALITLLLEAGTIKMGLATPGSYALDYVFGPPWQHRNLGRVISVWFGTDFILVLSALSGLYVVVVKLFRRGNSNLS